jgi:hypothetical protein
LDEDAEDTEDADEERSSFHSRTTMYIEAMQFHSGGLKDEDKGKYHGLFNRFSNRRSDNINY